MNANATEIARHKTAIWRPGLSLPIKGLLRDGFISVVVATFPWRRLPTTIILSGVLLAGVEG